MVTKKLLLMLSYEQFDKFDNLPVMFSGVLGFQPKVFFEGQSLCPLLTYLHLVYNQI